MARAKENDTVRIHFTAKLEDGTVVVDSEGQDAFEFTIGSNTVVSGLEDAVIGMEAGEQKTETVSPEAAFGEFRNDLVVDVPRTEFPPDVEIEPGQHFMAKGEDGSEAPLTVVSVQEDHITVDANHPLAGKSISFDIELVEIVE